MKLKLAACGMILSALLLGACDSAPYAGNADPVASEKYPHVAVETRTLQDALVFGPAVVEPTTDQKPMRVTIPVRNTNDLIDVKIQYRFEFMDAANRPLQTNLGWSYVALPHRIEVSLNGGAMESDARSWRLVVRPAQ